MAITVIGGKCGCVACKLGHNKPNAAYPRNWWLAHTNKHGRSFSHGSKRGGK